MTITLWSGLDYLVNASQDDGNNAGGEGGPQLPGVLGEGVLGLALHGRVHGRHAVRQLLHADHPEHFTTGKSNWIS
jgi:hypothetical protein